MTFLVMNVKRTLASVGGIAKRGNEVYVSSTGSNVHMTAGTWRPSFLKRGVHTLPIWVMRLKGGNSPPQEHPNGRQQ